jgi:two-component system, NtrC family, sensor kinase
MKKIGYSLIIALLSINVYGQITKEVDSMLRVLEKEKEDSNNVRTLARIGSYYTNNNPSKALEYFERAEAMAKKINNPLRLGNAYYDKGFCYLLKGDFDKSLANYLESAKLYEKIKDSRRLTNAYMSIGNVYFQNKDLTKSKEYYDKAEIKAIENKDSGQLSNIYAESGMMYDQLGDYDKALQNLFHAKDIATSIHDDGMVLSCLSNIGLAFKHKKNTTLALTYFDSILNIYKKIPDVPLDNICGIYNNIGAAQAQAGNYTKAIAAFNTSINYAKQINAPQLEMENYKNMADMFSDMNDYRQQSTYLKKYYNLKDSIFSADNKNQLTQLESDYQLEKKNNELSKTEALANKQKSQRNIFITIALIAGLVLGGLSYFYKKIKNQNTLLQEKNEQINQQKNELQTLNHVKDRLFSIISHDLRNPLVTLKSYMTLSDNPTLSNEQKEAFKKQTVQAVTQTSGMLDNLLVWANMQIKNTKPNIKPIELENSIDDAIGAAKLQALQKNITIIKKINAINAIADNNILEIALRNIITNAVKYSNANSTILVTTTNNNTHTLITVNDEGIGMSKEKLDELLQNEIESTYGTEGEKGSGLGLFLSKELLSKMNSSLHITSEINKGTIITIELPS